MKKLKDKHIEILREMVNYLCEECHKSEDIVGKLEPHRIKPESNGGEYIPRNIKMVCHNCHEKFSAAHRMACRLQ